MEAIFLSAAFFKVTNNVNKCDGADINLKPNYTTKTRSCGVDYYYLYEVTLSVHQKSNSSTMHERTWPLDKG
jgi:hypothetical protein